jgi:hypothetical protein
MDPNARTCRELTRKYSEGERQVFPDRVTSSDLTFELTSAEIEVVGYATKDFNTQFELWCKVSH